MDGTLLGQFMKQYKAGPLKPHHCTGMQGRAHSLNMTNPGHNPRMQSRHGRSGSVYHLPIQSTVQSVQKRSSVCCKSSVGVVKPVEHVTRKWTLGSTPTCHNTHVTPAHARCCQLKCYFSCNCAAFQHNRYGQADSHWQELLNDTHFMRFCLLWMSWESGWSGKGPKVFSYMVSETFPPLPLMCVRYATVTGLVVVSWCALVVWLY